MFLSTLDQAAGGPRPAALAEVFQDVQGLLIGQAGLLQDGALALGEAGLAGAAVDHADAPGLAAPAAEVEIFAAPDGRHRGTAEFWQQKCSMGTMPAIPARNDRRGPGLEPVAPIRE